MTLPVEIAGERVELRADRTLFWPRAGTLVVADPHFGKADAFRAAGHPVPGGPDDTLTRLTAAIRETAAARLVVLGDFWHDRTGITATLTDALADWRRTHAGVRIDLLRGNHDRAAPPPGWGLWADSLHEPPFVLTHIPTPADAGFNLAGHVHPGVRLAGRGRERLVLPCFRFGPRGGLLPAAGTLTGLAATPPGPGERVFAIAGSEVIEVSRRAG